MWSPEVVRVGLSAQRIVLAEAGGWRRRAGACERIECPTVPDAAPWQPAVSALAQKLAERKGRRPALHVVLSGRFVRWQLLPWRPELSRPQELEALARLRFLETFGNAAESWAIRLAAQPPGRAMPACAVDAALLEALRKSAEETGARLAAVTPYFAAAFDRWRGRFRKGPAWFGVVEPDCLTLGLLRGSWLGLRTQRLGEDWRAALPGLMAQIGIPAGLDAGAAPLYLAGEGEPPAPDGRLPFEWLQPQASERLPEGRLALGI